MKTRWQCTLCANVIMGPVRPALNHVCRFCLICSSQPARSLLVKREPVTLLKKKANKREAKREVETRKKARAEATRLAVLQRKETARENKPRRSTYEYVVMSPNMQSEVFGSEDFAEAWKLYRKTARARLQRITEYGSVYAAVIGYMLVQRGHTHHWLRNVLIGWNRIAPPYIGNGGWDILKNEAVVISSKCKIIAKQTRVPQ